MLLHACLLPGQSRPIPKLLTPYGVVPGGRDVDHRVRHHRNAVLRDPAQQPSPCAGILLTRPMAQIKPFEHLAQKATEVGEVRGLGGCRRDLPEPQVGH